MIEEANVAPEDGVRASISVIGFEGYSVKIALEEVKSALKFLEMLKTMGFHEVEIAIENNAHPQLFLCAEGENGVNVWAEYRTECVAYTEKK